MATIEDVAAKAGVSIATVSRVMNNSYMVSSEKREKVLAAAKALNYRTSRSAARQAENHVIMVAGPVFIGGIYEGIQDKAAAYDYDVVFSYTGSEQGQLKSNSLIRQGLVDGLILINYVFAEGELEELSSLFPVVQCGGILDTPDSFTVSINNERAANDVVNHLIGLGYSRIALVMPGLSDLIPAFTSEREIGYRSALLEHNLVFDPELVFNTDIDPESFDQTVQSMIGMDNPPDAIFCVFDTLAAGIMLAMQDANVKIPEEIAIAGFDNDEISEMMRPPLTTISQPRNEIGVECVRLLMSLLKEGPSSGRHILMAHRLMVRESTSPS